VIKDELLIKVADATSRSLPDGGTLVVAVSGGADSVCLLHALLQLKGELNLSLHVAHLNHSLRGSESDADAQYVAGLAAKMKLPYTVEKRDIRSYGATSSIEDKARHARYTFLAEVATFIKAEAVAVAHTADDQVETILMHLVRGSGLAGLCGMREVSAWESCTDELGVTIIRPLLGFVQKDVEAYCEANALAPRIDSSNRSLDYMRNRFRYELIPLIKTFNSNFKDALLRLASVVSDEIALLDEQVLHAWSSVVTDEDRVLSVDRSAFSRLPIAVKRHLVRRVLERLAGTLTDIESVHIDIMIEAMEKPVGKRLSLPHGLVLVNGYEVCKVGPDDLLTSDAEIFVGEYSLNVPGVTMIPGWKIIASIESKFIDENKSGFVECFDHDVVGSELIVRSKKQGDKLSPLGMNGSKSLKDLMIDLKIPKAERDGIPIICSPEHIIWVVGTRIDDRAKVLASTKRVLLIRFERIYIDSV
jgi:tRNA(Ile)-lysidine synthase